MWTNNNLILYKEAERNIGQYFEKYREDMLKEIENIKLLWWKQPWIMKGSEQIRGEQKNPGKTVISPPRQEIRNSKNPRKDTNNYQISALVRVLDEYEKQTKKTSTLNTHTYTNTD